MDSDKTKRLIKIADNLYKRPNSPNLYIVWHQGRRKRFKSTGISNVREAKRIRDEFLGQIRSSGLSRDERATYEQIRQLYIDHCTVHDLGPSLKTFLDTRAKHLDPFFGGMRVIEIVQGGHIGRYVAQRKREGGSNASINREAQIFGQMCRLAASDAHRIISRGIVPQIGKLQEPPERKGIVTDRQYAAILGKLPQWAVAPVMAINITGWRVRAVLSRRKIDLDGEFLLLDPKSSKNRTEYKWPLVGEMGELIKTQLKQIAKDERRLRRVIPWLFHRDGHPIPYSTLRTHWRRATAAAGYPGKIMHDFRRTAATRMDSTPGISLSVAMQLLGHKTDIIFRKYIQKHDERLVEAAARLTNRPKHNSGTAREQTR